MQILLEEKPFFQETYLQVNRRLIGHNHFLAFLDNDSRPSESFITSQQSFHQATDRAARLMCEAETQIRTIQQQVEKECAGLFKREYMDIVSTICNKPYWWERGDLLTVDLSMIRFALHDCVPDDAARFAGYLRRMIYAHLGRKLQLVASEEFRAKLDYLREVLSRSKGTAAEYHRFHFSFILILNNNATEEEFRPLRTYLKACLDHYTGYLGSATAFRKLLRKYHNDCFNDTPRHEWHSDPFLFHERYISLLGDFLKRAHQEARENADLAISGRLPDELALIVLDYAAIAERLPHASDITTPQDCWKIASSYQHD